jgi:sarcosine oxidase subunit beta
VLLEANELASGSSGKPLGGVRAQFSDPANIELGSRSLNAFHRFKDDFGVDIGYQQVGYLFLIRDDADVARYQASIKLQNSLGVDSRMITGAAAAELSPYVDASTVVAASWSPTDGFARPSVVVNTYAAAAAQLGAEICKESPVVGIEQAGGDRVAVRTQDGRVYTTPTVICTCGAWSKQIGAMVDVDLPIEPLRRQIAFTTSLYPRPPRVPFTIDYSTTAYFHCNDDGSGLHRRGGHQRVPLPVRSRILRARVSARTRGGRGGPRRLPAHEARRGRIGLRRQTVPRRIPTHRTQHHLTPTHQSRTTERKTRDTKPSYFGLAGPVSWAIM